MARRCLQVGGRQQAAVQAASGEPLPLIRTPHELSPPACPAEEVPAEGHTDSRFSVKCRWYRSVVTKGGQVRAAASRGRRRRAGQGGRPPRPAARLLLHSRMPSLGRCQHPLVAPAGLLWAPSPAAPPRCGTPRRRRRPAPLPTPPSPVCPPPPPTRRVPQYCWVHPEKEAAIQCILCLRCKVDTKKSYHCSPECLREHWAFHRDFHQQSRENGGWATSLLVACCLLAACWLLGQHAMQVAARAGGAGRPVVAALPRLAPCRAACC